MDKKDILKNVYEDFFGIEKLSRENEELSKEIEKLDGLEEINDIPSIEVKPKVEMSKEEKDNVMKQFFDDIEKLYITQESKDTLKKIIEYMRKYNEQIEKMYIPFNMCIYTDDEETIKGLINILTSAGKCFKYFNNDSKKEISIYDLEKPEELDKTYENSCFVVLKDIEVFNSKEEAYKRKFSYKLEDNIEKNEKTLSIIIAKNKDEVERLDLKETLFEFEIIGIKPDVQDVYQEVLGNLTNELKEDSKVQVDLLEYISKTYPSNELSYPEYRDMLCKKILFNKQIPEVEKEKSMEEILAELNELVGLGKVKQVINDLIDLIELRNKTKDDLKIKNVNLHMVFLGNPGTGKTTVARIISGILYNLKYIKQDKLIEVSSKDLVAEYVGQTAPKTMAVVEKALGGVLFIDEAYSLASGSGQGSSYNEEAIATLIQAMENYRDDLVVIFAGYTKEMQAFLNANSGIVSRIGYTLEFEDYTTDELIQIFTQFMQKAGFVVTDEAIEKVKGLIEEYKDTKNFGNARFVRNVYEKSIVKHAANTRNKKGKKVLKTITAEDISAENLLKM